MDAFKEFEIWIYPMKGSITLVRTDSESMYVHGVFAKYY